MNIMSEQSEFNRMLQCAIAECSTECSTEQCMITLASVDANHITLPCKHSFNYEALYSEAICRLKLSQSVHIYKYGVTVCPYCRAEHVGVLPYYPLDGIERIHGINSPSKIAMNAPNPCQYKYVSGRRRGELCGSVGYCTDLTKSVHMCTTHHRQLASTAAKKMNKSIDVNK